MSGLVYLIPIAIFLGGLGLAAFLWALRSDQFEDLDGAAQRVLFDDDDDPPKPDPFVIYLKKIAFSRADLRLAAAGLCQHDAPTVRFNNPRQKRP